jgi:hypothetical protein
MIKAHTPPTELEQQTNGWLFYGTYELTVKWKIKLCNKKTQCLHLIFWPRNQRRVHCHTAKPELNQSVTINWVPLYRPLRRGDCSRGHHMGEENHNRPFLLIPGLSLIYTFHSSIFPQVHTNMKFTGTHFHFI